MSVYVDPCLPSARNSNWRYRKSCHMTADRFDELHAMARRLGLKRAWFQPGSTLPHYDLTESKRSLAVRYGAVEITAAEMGKRVQRARAGSAAR